MSYLFLISLARFITSVVYQHSFILTCPHLDAFRATLSFVTTQQVNLLRRQRSSKCFQIRKACKFLFGLNFGSKGKYSYQILRKKIYLKNKGWFQCFMLTFNFNPTVQYPLLCISNTKHFLQYTVHVCIIYFALYTVAFALCLTAKIFPDIKLLYN